MEKQRAGAYAGLSEQVKTLAETHLRLHKETANLVTALRAPQGRGRWGEVQLKRVVELAGMVEKCDFDVQPSLQTENGRLRPDLIVHLPLGKRIVVDAKVPLKAYLEAVDASDDVLRRPSSPNTPCSFERTSSGCRQRATGSSSSRRLSSW